MRVRKRLGDTAQGFYSPYYFAWLRAVISQAFAAQLMGVLESEEHPTTTREDQPLHQLQPRVKTKPTASSPLLSRQSH
jgi:hypothetical protein